MCPDEDTRLIDSMNQHNKNPARVFVNYNNKTIKIVDVEFSYNPHHVHSRSKSWKDKYCRFWKQDVQRA